LHSGIESNHYSYYKAVGERNYHIFYHLLRGATIDKLNELCLTFDGKVDMTKFEYLRKAQCYEVAKIDDVGLYKEVVESFQTMNFSEKEQDAIWQITSACLQLGNVDFDEKTFNDSISFLLYCNFVATPCGLLGEQFVKNAAKLLHVKTEDLAHCLRHKIRTVGKEVIVSTMKKDDCNTARDSLAKELYNRLFNWLVKRLNYTILPEEDMKPGANKQLLAESRFRIGLLDIFGFEVFEFNSLEQFCINYTNEKLQQLYINYIFKAEEREFRNEDLADYLSELSFKDNQIVIDLMDKAPTGVFSLLDESCSVNSTDDALLKNIISKNQGKNDRLTIPKLSRDVFMIHHTAKDVIYNINGFRAKNRDELNSNIEECISGSSFPEIVNIFKGIFGNEKEEETGTQKKGGAAGKFLGAKFRIQMNELMNELQSCNCHFIRCLKPNEKKEPKLFISSLTLLQIRYMGVLDSIKIRKEGYPVRKVYKEFYQKYEVLDPDNVKTDYRRHCELGSDFKELTKKICAANVPQMGPKSILFGKTKIFMRIDAQIELDKILVEKMKVKNAAAKRIQQAWKRYLKRKLVDKYRTLMKRYILRWKMKKRFKRIYQAAAFANELKLRAFKTKYESAIVKIQKYYRMHYYRKRYLKAKEAIVKVQARVRGMIARKLYRKLKVCRDILNEIVDDAYMIYYRELQEKSALLIQRFYRGYRVRREHQEERKLIRKAYQDVAFRKSAIRIQRTARGWMVRSTLRILNNAAQYIQATYKMVVLTSLFKELRRSAIIIQRNVRLWLSRRNAISERLKEYLETEYLALHKRRVSEQFTLLGNLYKEYPKKFGKMIMIFVENYRFQ